MPFGPFRTARRVLSSASSDLNAEYSRPVPPPQQASRRRRTPSAAAAAAAVTDGASRRRSTLIYLNAPDALLAVLSHRTRHVAHCQQRFFAVQRRKRDHSLIGCSQRRTKIRRPQPAPAQFLVQQVCTIRIYNR